MTDITFDLSGRTAIIFGGTSGINLGIASAYAAVGARVAVVSRNQANVDEAVAMLGSGARGFVADVRDFGRVGEVLDELAIAWGPLDIVVAGAAGNFLAEAKDLSENGFGVVVDIDLKGTFNVLRQSYRHLRDGASVITISAPQATVAMKYQAHVAAAKAGVEQLTRVLALEWGERQIRVNAIVPGFVEETEGLRRLSSPGINPADLVPLGRLATVDDISSLALFLATSGSRFISGAIIACDGGGAIDSVKRVIEAAPVAKSEARRSA